MNCTHKLRNAIDENRLDEVRRLLAPNKFLIFNLPSQTDVNEADEEGRTPIFDAAVSGQVEVAALLIAKGARVEVVDVDGRTPLF